MISRIFHGALKPMQLALREMISLRIDRLLGVQTTDELVARSVGVNIDEFRRRQRALGWSGAMRVIWRLGLQPGDVFLDIGCGAGRMLCAAARTRARRVIGLDIDPLMTGLADQNARRLRGRNAEVQVITGDATAY